jgi:hypothetical protein
VILESNATVQVTKDQEIVRKIEEDKELIAKLQARILLPEFWKGL